MTDAAVRILCIEDSEEDYLLMLRQLGRAGYRTHSVRVQSREALVQALGEEWDAIVSDDSMPGFSGLEALVTVRGRGLETPFILLSGTIGEERAVEAMRAGAQDYIMKGSSARLVPALARELQEAEQRRKTRLALREREEQLQQAQRLEAVGQLAGGLAHDFNNILGLICLHADAILGRSEELPEIRGFAEGIIKAHDRASALVQKLLAFSRKQIVLPRRVDLSASVRAVEDVLGLAIGSGSRLILRLEPGLPEISADPVQIEQILMNLAVNARDAMPEGGTFTVETRSAAGEGAARVALVAKDTGTGMPPEVQARVFEPFFTTKELGKGSGLGLSTVFGIVKQLGGSISVKSGAGAGTEFRIEIPAAPPADPVAAERPADEAAERRQADEPPTLLVVEDEAPLREAMCRALEEGGYRARGVSSGAQALSLGEGLDEARLVITDLRMPVMSGMDLARELARIRPQLPVLFVSGGPSDGFDPVTERGPARHFLRKPFNGPMLLRKVREIIEAG